MRQSLSSFAFLLLTSSVLGQANDIPVERPALSAVDSIEKANHGKITSYEGITYSLSSNYFPGSDSFRMGQPIISNRDAAPIGVGLNYYFSLPDSTIRLIEYTWDAGPDERNDLNQIFDRNVRHFSKLFAKNGTIKQEDHNTWTQRTIAWENDQTTVEQFMVTGEGTYRVRVLVSWKH